MLLHCISLRILLLPLILLLIVVCVWLGVKMPINCITTMLPVCRQVVNVVITEVRAGVSSCAHRGVFSGWLRVVLGTWDGGDSSGDDVI